MKQRRSIRGYKPDPVPKELIRKSDGLPLRRLRCERRAGQPGTAPSTSSASTNAPPGSPPGVPRNVADPAPYLGRVEPWQTENLKEPLDELLGTMAVSSVVVGDSEPCRRLAIGVEGLFRSELSAQWEPWPPASTTDGSAVHFCVRTGAVALELVGMTFIDFAGEQFPFRAQLARDAGEVVSVALSIGQIDSTTGHPPRLVGGAAFVPVAARTATMRWELLSRRRQVPITWTKVVDWRDANDEHPS